MIGDAAQHIGEPGLGIDAVEFGSGNQRIDCGCALATAIGTGEAMPGAQGKLVYGPFQIEARINQNTEISQQLGTRNDE
jgi:hypothetical protein